MIVDDNAADVFLIREAITAANVQGDISVLKDGEQAIQALDEWDKDDVLSCPDLVILDINLPKRLGSEVLQHMRDSRRCVHARVIVVSTSGSVPDRERMMKLGANDYFHKPSTYADFMKLGKLIKQVLTDET